MTTDALNLALAQLGCRSVTVHRLVSRLLAGATEAYLVVTSSEDTTIIPASIARGSKRPHVASERLTLLHRMVAGARPPAWDVSELDTADGRHVLLVVAAPSLQDRVHRAREDWSLTERQADVLALVAAGSANKEVARKLSITESAVEAHVGRILERAGVDSRSSLIVAFWTEI